jgi:hypothetical protein
MIYFLPSIVFVLVEIFMPVFEGKHPNYANGTHWLIGLLLAPVFKAWEQRKARLNLIALADRLGLHLQETGLILGIFAKTPTVEGRYRGRNVRFFNYFYNINRWGRKALRPDSEGIMAGGMRWNAVGASIAGNSEFILETEAKRPGQLMLETRIRRLDPNRASPFRPKLIPPGLHVVSTDDPTFDQALRVQSNDPARAKEILTAKIRAQFLEQPSKWHPLDRMIQVIIRDGEVRYAAWGPTGFASKTRAERIAAKLDFVCELAESVESHQASSAVKNLGSFLTQKF